MAKGKETLPREPDYSVESQWYTTHRGGEADIFYVISTETIDHKLENGEICHFADTHLDSLRLLMQSEMEGVDMLLGGHLNFFSPYYRQCSLESFANDSAETARRMAVPTRDVKRAFAYYLANLNQGRPFVLAGFSQGAIIALDLLREMDDTTYNRMIAAYIIGFPITTANMQSPRIIPAKGANDTGVTISYNSVRDVSCRLWPERSAFAINPMNWRTDGKKATLITEPSPLIPVEEQTKDTMTVHLDTASNLLIVKGYSSTDYEIPIIGREGNYHSREVWLYRDQLRENIALRTRQFLTTFVR